MGCGRGSISSYFAANHWNVTLLDSSQSILLKAKSIFKTNRHKAFFVSGDANTLPFSDESFDVTVSIGLLEHFENVRVPIEEQIRLLRSGGWFLGYIVPERPDNIQKYFNWINAVLKKMADLFSKESNQKTSKTDIFRSNNFSDHYIKTINGLEYENLTVFGMYSLPMISHSPEFPFSLMPKQFENVLTKFFTIILKIKKKITKKHGWICSEKLGQAFLIAFQKPSEKYRRRY